MDDHQGGKDFRDQDRVNVDEVDEVKYWSLELHISPDRLKELIRFHGPVIEDIKNSMDDIERSALQRTPPA